MLAANLYEDFFWLLRTTSLHGSLYFGWQCLCGSSFRSTVGTQSKLTLSSVYAFLTPEWLGLRSSFLFYRLGHSKCIPLQPQYCMKKIIGRLHCIMGLGMFRLILCFLKMDSTLDLKKMWILLFHQTTLLPPIQMQEYVSLKPLIIRCIKAQCGY